MGDFVGIEMEGVVVGDMVGNALGLRVGAVVGSESVGCEEGNIVGDIVKQSRPNKDTRSSGMRLPGHVS